MIAANTSFVSGVAQWLNKFQLIRREFLEGYIFESNSKHKIGISPVKFEGE